MIGIVSSRWQVRIVSKYLPDFENTCRRSTIALFLARTRLILSGEPRAPCQSAFAKQGWERSSYTSPLSAARSFKYSQLPAHRVPSRRGSDAQLRAVIGNTLRICGDNNEAQARNRKAAGNRHKLYKEIILSIPLLVFTSAETARGDSFLSAPIRVSLNRYTYENITFDRSNERHFRVGRSFYNRANRDNQYDQQHDLYRDKQARRQAGEILARRRNRHNQRRRARPQHWLYGLHRSGNWWRRWPDCRRRQNGSSSLVRLFSFIGC